jgi:Protein of unknown function (DUF4232)
MNLRASAAARRIVAAAAVTCAAALAPAAALASPGTHTGTAVTPACATSGLDVWLDTQGSGVHTVTDYFLNFTNLSGRRCTLHGYPGVSGVTLTGTQLGSAASRVFGPPHTVTLANGATTHALVGIVDPGVIVPASKCRPVTAAGLRVYPPNQTTSRVAPFPFIACSRRGPIYLTVGPVGFP